MKTTSLKEFLAILLFGGFCLFADMSHSASSERLLREVQCNHQANGAQKILVEVRTGIPQELWFEVYPIPESYNDDQVALIHQVVNRAYHFEGSVDQFMKDIFNDCMNYKDI